MSSARTYDNVIAPSYASASLIVDYFSHDMI